ncbi:hypothetical protein IX39_18075 [Chryseobacterium formosense]|uniref:DUF6759 domain-containing protein n=1 Tax=Chryseobacterium formosense TaxID=236814 RepID=A0A085YZS1_9FLAO|nr:DUF6759 domain-containing protein [Chryseobacterium formosense]KFE97684.1 hypothetical protein IX39_18075 [Chryseobacterium formosense]SFT84841.1 hypothetical protein SAMN05421857_3704 [Chryseobacterium formosense]
MKKIFLIIFLFVFSIGFAQKKKKAKATKAVAEKEVVIIYTLEEAMASSEPRIIAGFIKQNPGHEKNNDLKRKLVTIIMADNSIEAKPTIKPISKDKIEKIVSNNELNKGKDLASTAKAATPERTVTYASMGSSSKKSEPSEQAKKTASLLTHLFSNDPNNNEAYVNIKNLSKCRLIVKISGKKYYNLDVPAKGDNFVLIEKGDYVVTTSVCDAKYSSLKKINKDIEIQLNVAE